MASPTPTPSGLPQPTRQQLDDLDALLQRMLALPVSPTEEEPPPEPPLPEPPPPPMMLEPPPGNMVLSDPILAPPPLPPEPPEPRPLPLLNPVPPHARRPPTLSRPEPAPLPPPVPGASRPPAVPLLLRPLVWCNRGYDRVALSLGGVGDWLRRPIGRALLGLTGLVLLAAAAALVVLDRMGWAW